MDAPQPHEAEARAVALFGMWAVLEDARDESPGRGTGLLGPDDQARRGPFGVRPMRPRHVRELSLGRAWAEGIAGACVSVNAFEILREQPVLGRGFTQADETGPPVVLLGDRLWHDRYDADSQILGRTLSVNGVPSTVIGVMREGFEFPFREIVWQPLPHCEQVTEAGQQLGVFGRLKDGVGIDAAADEVQIVFAALDSNDQRPAVREGARASIVNFGERQVGRFGEQPPPVMLSIAALMVMLVACANAASLLMARGVERSAEIAVRSAIGATRSRLIRHVLAESWVLAFASGAVAIALSRVGVAYSAESFGRNVPYWMDFSFNAWIAAIVAAACACIALVAGALPAWTTSRPDINAVMTHGQRSGTAPNTRRLTKTILIAQLALTVVLMSVAVLMLRSFAALQESDSVVDADRVMTARISLPTDRYSTPEERSVAWRRLDAQIRSLTSGATAAASSARPFVGAKRQLVLLEGQDSATPSRPLSVAVGAQYFEALGLRLLAGRTFDDRDGTPGNEVVVVNQLFAERYFGDSSPLGSRIQLLEDDGRRSGSAWLTIVGVSPTVRQAVASAPGPVVYLRLTTHGSAEGALIVGNVVNAGSMLRALKERIASVDPDLVVSTVRPLPDLMADSRLQHRLIGTQLMVAGTVALLLSLVGLYAITAYAAKQRRQEIGVRIALGARRYEVVLMFLKQGLPVLGVGLGLGLVGALFVGQVVRGLLVQTSPTDVLSLMSVLALQVVVALTAYALPAWRASRLDPLIVLRNE